MKLEPVAAHRPPTWRVTGREGETQPQAKKQRNNNKILTKNTMVMLVSFLVGTVIGMTYMAMAATAKERKERECAFFGWMVRDRDGEAWVHETEPEKDLASGQWVPKSGLSMRVYPEQMKSIRWTDDKATRVCLTIDRERRYGDD